MPPHKCEHEEDFGNMKSVNTKISILFGMVGLFMFVAGFAVNQSSKAGEKADRAVISVGHVNSRIDVQDEKLRWILEGISRIEKKLEEKP